jgi:hypothetical protein
VKLPKIPEKLYLPAAIVAGCGAIGLGLAYGLAPEDARAPIVAGVAAVWGVVQSLLPALLSGGGKAEE